MSSYAIRQECASAIYDGLACPSVYPAPSASCLHTPGKAEEGAGRPGRAAGRPPWRTGLRAEQARGKGCLGGNAPQAERCGARGPGWKSASRREGWIKGGRVKKLLGAGRRDHGAVPVV